MLVEFTVKNYRSIDEAQTLSLIADSSKHLRDSNTFTVKQGRRNLRLLRSAVIYGANASGKSNIISALQTMWKIILESAKSQRGDEISVEPFVFKQENQSLPTEFDISFILDSARYQYGFSATKKQILEEWLYSFDKNNEPVVWFERELISEDDSYIWADDAVLPLEKEFWKKSTRDNELFLAKAVQLNADELQGVFDFFQKRKFGIINIAQDFSINVFTQYLCESDEWLRERVLNVVRAADASVVGIKIKTNKISPAIDRVDDTNGESLSDYHTKNVLKEEFLDNILISRNVNGDVIDLPISQESLGTKKIFKMAGFLLSTLRENSFMLMDELNTHLHPLLTDYLIQQFNNPLTNIKNAQLVFTTHDVSVLNNKNFRRDQVWFVRKTENLNSQLYSLAEFKEISRNEKYANNYLLGRYDGIPYLPELPLEEVKK